MLEIRSQFQREMYDLLFKKEHQRILSHMDHIGKRNSHLQDAQTYSFIHKDYTHQSNTLNITTARTPPLAKQLYEDFIPHLAELKELDKFYCNVCSMYVYIRNSPVEQELLALLPAQIQAIYDLRVKSYAPDEFVRDSKRQQATEQFNAWYGKTLEDVFAILFMNMIY